MPQRFTWLSRLWCQGPGALGQRSGEAGTSGHRLRPAFLLRRLEPQAVDAFHAGGLSSGGRDNGRPGLRPDYGAGYYAAYLVDPDGYRIEAYYAEQG